MTNLTCPVLRNLPAIAPRTAACTSAVLKTMKGAFPPNSSETFLIVLAHLAISFYKRDKKGVEEGVELTFPVAVDPVNDNLPIRSSSNSVLLTSSTDSRLQVITFNTPAGNPAS